MKAAISPRQGAHGARLLVIDEHGRIAHRTAADLPSLLRRGDLVVKRPPEAEQLVDRTIALRPDADRLVHLVHVAKTPEERGHAVGIVGVVAGRDEGLTHAAEIGVRCSSSRRASRSPSGTAMARRNAS